MCMHRLEKEIRGSYYCAFCNKLQYTCASCVDPTLVCKHDQRCSGHDLGLRLDEGYTLRYRQVRMLGNAHSYGNGLLVDILSKKLTGAEKRPPGQPVRFRHSNELSARFIKNQLFVCGKYTAYVSLDDYSDDMTRDRFSSYIANTCISINNHTHEQLNIHYFTDAGPSLTTHFSTYILGQVVKSGPTAFDPSGHVYSCTRCMMDFDVEIGWMDGCRAITITTYRQLSDHISDWYPTYSPQFRSDRYWHNERAGKIRHQWLHTMGLVSDDDQERASNQAEFKSRGAWCSSPKVKAKPEEPAMGKPAKSLWTATKAPEQWLMTVAAMKEGITREL
ncbi:uncharacterized protein BCR38DRAFT_411309 [Pseudomassariella vexata]|uniref:Uncharacterized protein n=1 Tax=Pseudomassariella vexata TaxID=1141098 RepID=A0A1Y2DQP8_9PEZI|nr:uncharacterized protein BCR38DRAFT_411309 [Pseudomassariella vexata]ORY61436.1 hypothetical protein BCR38DRAFT_411309 [Pseudomassariella vexata]